MNMFSKSEKIYFQNDIVSIKNFSKDLFAEGSVHFYTSDNDIVYLKDGEFEYIYE